MDIYWNLIVVVGVGVVRECPEELKEATAGIIYAASRCGEFPELQETRAVLTSRYGKHFTASAVELRNNCGVHPQVPSSVHSLFNNSLT